MNNNNKTLIPALLIVAILNACALFWSSVPARSADPLLGGTLLSTGECHRVLDDPSAVNRYVFRTFQQYMVFCIEGRKNGTPWNRPLLANLGWQQPQAYNRV